MRFSCRCKNLLQTGHEPTCFHALFTTLKPLLKDFGYHPHTYPNHGMPYTCDNRFSKIDGEGTQFVDLYPVTVHNPFMPIGIEIKKWRESRDEQGWVKTTYDRTLLTEVKDLPLVRKYLENYWEVTLINKQSDWEALFHKLEKERNAPRIR